MELERSEPLWEIIQYVRACWPVQTTEFFEKLSTVDPPANRNILCDKFGNTWKDIGLDVDELPDFRLHPVCLAFASFYASVVSKHNKAWTESDSKALLNWWRTHFEDYGHNPSATNGYLGSKEMWVRDHTSWDNGKILSNESWIVGAWTGHVDRSQSAEDSTGTHHGEYTLHHFHSNGRTTWVQPTYTHADGIWKDTPTPHAVRTQLDFTKEFYDIHKEQHGFYQEKHENLSLASIQYEGSTHDQCSEVSGTITSSTGYQASSTDSGKAALITEDEYEHLPLYWHKRYKKKHGLTFQYDASFMIDSPPQSIHESPT